MKFIYFYSIIADDTPVMYHVTRSNIKRVGPAVGAALGISLWYAQGSEERSNSIDTPR